MPDIDINAMIRGLVRAAEFKEQEEGSLRDNECGAALVAARELGWGLNKTGTLAAVDTKAAHVDDPVPPNTKIRDGKVVTTEGETPIPAIDAIPLTLEQKVEQLWAFVGEKYVRSSNYAEVEDPASPLARMIRERTSWNDVHDTVKQEIAMDRGRSSLRARMGNYLRKIADRVEHPQRSRWSDLEDGLGRKIDPDEIEVSAPLNTGIFK